jgi:hypothetical protein
MKGLAKARRRSAQAGAMNSRECPGAPGASVKALLDMHCDFRAWLHVDNDPCARPDLWANG